MKVYISGMITSLREDQYRKAFKEAAKYLEEQGHEPVDPSILGKPEQRSWHYYMKKAIAQLVECDAIYMLRNYSGSRGALLEKKIAEGLDMPVFYAEIERISDTQLLNEDLDTGNYGQEPL
jgi:Asp-tRNA(Asn)/Glu-tRNA(Gln) amidotransferase A subunit family amidase